MGIFMLDVGMQPIGGVIAGILATYYGVSLAWAFGGIMGVISVILITLIVRKQSQAIHKQFVQMVNCI